MNKVYCYCYCCTYISVRASACIKCPRMLIEQTMQKQFQLVDTRPLTQSNFQEVRDCSSSLRSKGSKSVNSLLQNCYTLFCPLSEHFRKQPNTNTSQSPIRRYTDFTGNNRRLIKVTSTMIFFESFRELPKDAFGSVRMNPN